jgi:hypothetical protein
VSPAGDDHGERAPRPEAPTSHTGSDTEKFMIMIHMNPALWEGLGEDRQQAVMDGHRVLHQEIAESGELVSSYGLGDPELSSVVSVRDGVPVVTDGPYVESKEFLAGFILVDVENRERAHELAARVPDAALGVGVEVRPVMYPSADDV